jgi:hypothetical protein
MLRLETGIHHAEAVGLYTAAGCRETASFGDYRPGGPHSRILAKPFAAQD